MTDLDGDSVPNTVYTKKLEARRNSPEVQSFKERVNTFLRDVGASEELVYRLRCDLSKKIDMPFYGEPKVRPGNMSLSVVEIAKEYVLLLIRYGDEAFSEELLSWLTKQQGQTFRRIHRLSQKQKERKRKIKSGVYEHPVPVNYSKLKLLEYIEKKNADNALRYIEYMSANIPQVFLTTEEDSLVNRISKDSMPEGWNWETDSPFERYIRAGIPEDVYK
ncbi:MAG: hypothetical protein IJS71_00650 [Clostridia bacterium]|nr:hypothetical protein [Clostridia bacterium]